LSSQAHPGRRGYSGADLGVGPNVGGTGSRGIGRDEGGEPWVESRAIRGARDQAGVTWDSGEAAQATVEEKVGV